MASNQMKANLSGVYDNNQPPEDVMRENYRVLSDADKANMARVKHLGVGLHDFIHQLGSSRETSLAKTKVEEAIMWAVKHITR